MVRWSGGGVGGRLCGCGMAAKSPTRLPVPFEAEKHTISDRLLTVEDVAVRWQVPKTQVYRLGREGRLPAVRIGRYYRFRLSAIDAFELEGGASADG